MDTGETPASGRQAGRATLAAPAGAPPPPRRPQLDPGSWLPRPRPGRGANGCAGSRRAGRGGGAVAAARRPARAEGAGRRAHRPWPPSVPSATRPCTSVSAGPDQRPPPFAVSPRPQSRAPRPGMRGPGMRGPEPGQPRCPRGCSRRVELDEAGAATPEPRSGRRGRAGVRGPPRMRPGWGSRWGFTGAERGGVGRGARTLWEPPARSCFSRPFPADTWPGQRGPEQ